MWHGAAWNFVIWGGLHGLLIVIHKQYRRLFHPLPALLAPGADPAGRRRGLGAVPRRGAGGHPGACWAAWPACNGIALPQMIVSAFPSLAAVADPVPVLPFLGDARTLSFPEVSACLLLGWLIVLTAAERAPHDRNGRAAGR